MSRTPWTDSTQRVAPDITAGMVLRISGFIEPCLPSPAERVPSGPGWVYEIKHDGFRMMVRRDAAGVRLLTRNGHDWAQRYPLIVEAVNSTARPSPATVLALPARASVGQMPISNLWQGERIIGNSLHNQLL